MRIDRLHIENFNGFENKTFEFLRSNDAPIESNGSFHVMIGRNGTGKTTVLDAVSVALAVWLVHPPDTILWSSRRKILKSEIRLASSREGDRIQFRQMSSVSVTAVGTIAGRVGVEWTRASHGNNYSDERKAKPALDIIESVYDRDRRGEKLVCPVLAYYGAGRAWLPSNKRSKDKAKSHGPARRWGAFYDCFNERIRTAELQDWFLGETIAGVNRGGRMRPGFEAVKRAVLSCVPEANNIWYDSDLKQVVLSIGNNAQPFDNLSAGQRMMLALVADLAIKAVTQNAFLLPADELGRDDEPLPRVLRETPGVVLIDELDVHLHPEWQRHVVEDLRRTFPAVQFIATTHSPFIVQTLREGELIMLEGQTIPEVGNRGIDEIARGLMGVKHPETNDRYFAMKDAAKNYLLTLEEAAIAPEEKLQAYLDRLAQGIDQFADNPAYQAFLELQREGRLGSRLKGGRQGTT